MASAVEVGGPPATLLTGRAKHLSELALIFSHRHGTWRDFCTFLKIELKEVEVPGLEAATKVEPMRCRHAPGGQHPPELRQGPSLSSSHKSVFNHISFRRPCITTPPFEEGKAPGLVVADLCIRAQKFLASIGKGEVDPDFRNDDEHSQPSEAGTSSLAPDSYGEIGLDNIVETLRRRPEDDSQTTSNSYGASAVFDEVDVEQIMLEADAPESQDTIPADGSQISVITGEAKRLSTKIRVAVLAYLLKFANDPTELAIQFRRLVEEPTLQVLHLCGCGLCFKAEDGTRVCGCIEKTHLTLGIAVTNGRHTQYHAVMKNARQEDYGDLCGIIHRAIDGKGLF